MHVDAPSLSDLTEAYDSRFAQGNFRETDGFYRWVLKVLAPTPGAALLDVSCGEGHLLKWGARLRQLVPYGIDISATALQIARRNAPSARLARSNGMALPFPDETFPFVTNLGSLEHYTDIPLGIREMARVVKPDGKLAILLPNSYYLADIVWWVWRTGYGPSHQQLLEKFATLGEWKDLLAEEGIETVRAYPYNFSFPTSASDWRWYRGRPRRLLNLLIAPLVPANLAYCFLFIGRKKLAQPSSILPA
jgi:ubiquinone/menaquinone biosynthesis C-methylase UbiE